MGKGLIIGIVVLILIIGGFLIFRGGDDTNVDSGQLEPGNTDKVDDVIVIGDTNNEEEMMDDEETITPETKTFSLDGQNFKFIMDGSDNPDLVVNEGDTVKIEFKSIGGFHDWVVDEFNAATTQVRETDGMVSVEFVADKKGTFEYYCSVGQHRQQGMKGSLVVN
jgi:plastocyanin